MHCPTPVVIARPLTYIGTVLDASARMIVDTSNNRARMARAMAAMLITFGAAFACTESTLAPLPLDISLTASRTAAAPGDTILFVATVQGGSLLGLDADYGDSTADQYGTAGARTGKVTFRHAYTARGIFTAKITVTDATAGQKNATIEIHVN